MVFAAQVHKATPRVSGSWILGQRPRGLWRRFRFKPGAASRLAPFADFHFLR
jgi:hypothetical protein